MNARQRALRFDCEGSCLVGIANVPARPLARGVLVVTGGPQYRAGSHRQFTLLARSLEQQAIPVMRFDQRGMGDSEGAPRSFETIGADIASAVKEFFIQVPEMKELVIWGLCDGATAAAFYAATDARVRGLVLLNPWVRTAEGAARATLRHYYLGRVVALDFWKKVATGGIGLMSKAGEIGQQVRLAGREPQATLPQRMAASLARFDGQVMVILSGDDLTAREFEALMHDGQVRCRHVDIARANHTFARRVWRDQVAGLCADWIVSW